MADEAFRRRITGCVLAGGQGSRMGGIDKGLQPWNGVALARHALARLRRQLEHTAVVANRNLDTYRSWGAPVWSDLHEGFQGPLAGIQSALTHAETEWVLTVPCDVPNFPDDLATRMWEAVTATGRPIAIAAVQGAVQRRLHPVFCLLHRALLPTLSAALASGERRMARWAMSQDSVEVAFADEAAFANLNTLEDLKADLSPRA